METRLKNTLEINTVNSLDCFDILTTNNKAQLVDVRTKSEWEFVGIPDLSSINKKTFFISWQNYPSMNKNEYFEKEIIKAGIRKDDHLYFLCRSGQRSLQAARLILEKGYYYCCNIEDGFEGNKNSNYQRSTINGWKYNKLPWKQ